MALNDGTYGGNAGDQQSMEQQQRQALLAQLAAGAAAKPSPLEAGGITGGATGVLQGPPVQPGANDFPGAGGAGGATPAGSQPAAGAPDYTQMGEYANRMGAYNGDKFNTPWDQRSEKYQIGTVLSHFDPNKGLTPEAIAALNAANIHGAKFSGSGDKLTVDNAGGYDRFGKGGTGDIIGDFNNPNVKDKNWGAWFVDPNTGEKVQAPGGGAGATPGGPMSFLNNDAMSGLMDSGFFKQLMEHAQQQLGPQSTDRKALLAQLGI